MQWIRKQHRRFRRLVAILPRLLAMLCRHPLRQTASLGRIVFFNGFEGIKAAFRDIEAECFPPPRYVAFSYDAPLPWGYRYKPGSCSLDRFDLTTSGYVILAPGYVTSSAGVVCLYRLCNDLNTRGFPSYIVGSKHTPKTLAAPLIDWNEGIELCRHGYTAVYPEIADGNRLRAPYVARWVLNRPGLLGGDKVFDESELVFNYSSVYEPYIKNAIAGKLYLPTIDESIFFSNDPDGPERPLECYYIGKSQWQDGSVDRDRAFEITRGAPRKRELGKLLRITRVLYTFDNSTIFTYEAILCGCPAVIIPDGTQTKEDYARSELGMDGIAWGVEELDQARADVPKLRARYEQVKREYVEQLDRFIAATQLRVASNTTVIYPTSGVLCKSEQDTRRLTRRAVA
jgi:O-antigen biosynthesis protein